MMLIYASCVMFLAVVRAAVGLECFTCSATTPDTMCELDPHNVITGSATLECNQGENQCCMIQRQESNSKTGTIHSLFRGCQANCTVDNFVSLTGPSYTVYYTYCSNRLCNGGRGNQPIGVEPKPEAKEQNASRQKSSAANILTNLHLFIALLVVQLLSVA